MLSRNAVTFFAKNIAFILTLIMNFIFIVKIIYALKLCLNSIFNEKTIRVLPPTRQHNLPFPSNTKLPLRLLLVYLIIQIVYLLTSDPVFLQASQKKIFDSLFVFEVPTLSLSNMFFLIVT